MDDIRDNLLPWIGKTAKMLDWHHNQILQSNGFDLTKEQWVLLRVLAKHNGASQVEIACIANRDKTTMTRLVNTMEKKNYVARIPSKNDKRINLLHLTKKGERILEETMPLVTGVISNIQKDIPSNDIELVIDVLKKVQENLSNIDGC